MGAAASAPVINDVTTNPSDPPVLLKSRHSAELSDDVKNAINKYYSDLKPVPVAGADVATVFAAAKRAAAALPRARVVYEDAAGGALELLDVTPLLKFKDDVAIRLREQGGSVVVDVRSASRVGKGDLGANAARIRSYLAALRAELGQQGGA